MGVTWRRTALILKSYLENQAGKESQNFPRQHSVSEYIFSVILGHLASLRKDNKFWDHTPFLTSFGQTSNSIMMFCFPFIAIDFFFSF